MKVSRLCTDIPRAATSAWALHTALPLFDSNTSSLAESAAHRLPHSKMQKATENEGCGVKCCLQRVAAPRGQSHNSPFSFHPSLLTNATCTPRHSTKPRRARWCPQRCSTRPRFARCARALSQWHERRRGTSSLTDPVRNNWLDDHMEQIEGSLREMDPTLLDVRQKLVKLFDKEQVPLLHQAYVWSGNNQDSPFSL